MRQLDEITFMSGQIAASDVQQLKAADIGLIINNRPEGEDPGQPSGAEIEQAAAEAGIDYRHIPIARGIGPADVEQMAQAIQSAEGKVLAYCRSGTRSTLVWALARRTQDADTQSIHAAAEGAGVDLAPIAHLL